MVEYGTSTLGSWFSPAFDEVEKKKVRKKGASEACEYFRLIFCPFPPPCLAYCSPPQITGHFPHVDCCISLDTNNDRFCTMAFESWENNFLQRVAVFCRVGVLRLKGLRAGCGSLRELVVLT